MKKVTALLIVILFFCTGFADFAIIEGINHNELLANGWSQDADQEVAYLWVAQNTFELDRVEFHTSPVDGIIRLREFDGDGRIPGDVLSEVTYTSDNIGWNGGTFLSSISITAGESYFISLAQTSGITDHVAEGGVMPTLFWQRTGSTQWNGPYNSVSPMIRFGQEQSIPEPGTLSMLLAGGIGLILFIRKPKRIL